MKHFEGCEMEDYGYKYWQDREYFHPQERKTNIIKVIDDGRAKESGYGNTKEKDQNLWEVCEHDGDFEVLDNEVYVSANGNVTSCCDMSFKRIDEECIGNVNEDSLETIIRRHCEFDGSIEDVPMKQEEIECNE
jgi:hypothetical protein